MMSLCALTAPLLRTLKKILTRCVKITYMQEHGTSCPPFLSNIRDLAILPKILQIETPWWKLSLDTVANLFQQETDGLIHLLTFDTRSIDPVIIHSIGQAILHYRQTIRQDLPFRLKRLHVWNVSGWTPAQMGNDPKLRLIRRLLHTGPVALQETRWHQETPQILYHTIPGIQVAHTAGLQTEKRRSLGRYCYPSSTRMALGQNGRNYTGACGTCSGPGPIHNHRTNLHILTPA